jgi:hypothetical protein
VVRHRIAIRTSSSAITAEPPPSFDFVTNQELGGRNILELIEFANPKFSALTEYHHWEAK